MPGLHPLPPAIVVLSYTEKGPLAQPVAYGPGNVEPLGEQVLVSGPLPAQEYPEPLLPSQHEGFEVSVGTKEGRREPIPLHKG